jgi:hypothetical protein
MSCQPNFIKKTVYINNIDPNEQDIDIDLINMYAYYDNRNSSEKNYANLYVSKQQNNDGTSMKVIENREDARLLIDMCVKKCNNGSIPQDRNIDIIPTKQNILGGLDITCNDNASTEINLKSGEKKSESTIYKCISGMVDVTDPSNPKCKYKPEQYPLTHRPNKF